MPQSLKVARISAFPVITQSGATEHMGYRIALFASVLLEWPLAHFRNSRLQDILQNYNNDEDKYWEGGLQQTIGVVKKYFQYLFRFQLNRMDILTNCRDQLKSPEKHPRSSRQTASFCLPEARRLPFPCSIPCDRDDRLSSRQKNPLPP